MASYTPVRLAYNKYEPESKDTINSTPVIFLHGLTQSKEHWYEIPQTVANKTKRKVYTVDARNHGDSEWTDQYNLDLNADDLLNFMDTVGEEKAIIVGHSMGGITAMRASHIKPERIERIIVEDMFARIAIEHIGAIIEHIKYLQKLVKDIPPEMTEEEAESFCFVQYDTMLRADFTEDQMKDKRLRFHFPLKKDSTGHYTNKANFDVIIRALEEPGTLQSELKGKFNGPAHFIYGTCSVFKVLEDADNIKKFFPNAEFTGIEDASHDVHDDYPQEFMEALLNALGYEHLSDGERNFW